MNTSISSQRVGEFTAAVASDAPTPGGGAVAGIVAALGAALVGMAGRYAAKRDPESAVFPGLVERSDRLRARAAELADADAEATAAATFHVLDEWLAETGEDAGDFYHRSLIVVVGRSNNVGKPAVSLAYDRQAAAESVDEWASANGRLGFHTRRADVLLVAAGSAGLIRSEHIRAGAIVLDVGINPMTDPENSTVHMVGDVAFDDVIGRARAVTPVPGGIGPVTDVWLLRNAITAAAHAAHADAAPSPAPRVTAVRTDTPKRSCCARWTS